MTDAIKIFVSYEHKDEDLLKELENQLSPLQNKGLINLWDTRSITPGAVSSDELQMHLKQADIFLLLITANYIASKNYSYEMNFAMNRQREGKAHVIPILLSPVYWEGEDYGKLKPLPDNRQPVSSWRSKADAFFNIAEGIRRVVKELITPSPTSSSEGVSAKAEPVQNVANNRGQGDYDVFLCYNSADRPAIMQIGEQLKIQKIRPWLDVWELQPGLPWQRALEKQIEQIKAAAVFVGEGGIGPWQQMESEAFLREFVNRGCPVIPVILEDAPAKPPLPIFLRGMTWVDFRLSGPEPMERLIWGITGKRP